MGRLEGKQEVERPKRKWMDDITDWIGLEAYGKAKRAAEQKERWRLMVSTFVYEVDK